MKSVLSVLSAIGLATAVQAFTQPKDATWGPLLLPDLTHPVTQGQTFTVSWDPESHPTDGVTVSLVLCRGGSSNCVTDSKAIVEGVPASKKSYDWDVPCDLAAGTQNTDTGYGMLVIVDGTGEFQYSTQFSVLANPKCGGSSTSSWTSSSTVKPTGSKNETTSSKASFYISGAYSTWASSTTSVPGGHQTGGSWGASSSSWTTTVAASMSYATASASMTAAGTTNSPSASASLVQSFNNTAISVGPNAAGVIAAALAVMLL